VIALGGLQRVGDLLVAVGGAVLEVRTDGARGRWVRCGAQRSTGRHAGGQPRENYDNERSNDGRHPRVMVKHETRLPV
jgi:hypothetical protein